MLLNIIKPIKLLAGSHANTGETGQGCFMNVIAYLNGEAKITDQSTCVCPSMHKLLIYANDLMVPKGDGHLLLPFIERAMGSATSGDIKYRLGLVVDFAKWCAPNAYAPNAPNAYAADAYAVAYAAAYTTNVAAYTTNAAAVYTAAATATFYPKLRDRLIELFDAALPESQTVSDIVFKRARKLVEITN